VGSARGKATSQNTIEQAGASVEGSARSRGEARGAVEDDEDKTDAAAENSQELG